MNNKTYHWADLKYEGGIYHPIDKGNEHHTFISTGYGIVLQLCLNSNNLHTPSVGWAGYLFTKSDKRFKFTIE